MSDTKAPWFRTPARTPGRADPATPGRIPNPRVPAGGSKRKGRENREKRRQNVPQRKPGGAPSYKPYDYPQRPRPLPERSPRPVSPPAKPGALRVPKVRIPGVPLGNPWLDVIEQIPDVIWPSIDVPPILPANYHWCKGPVSFPKPPSNPQSYYTTTPFFRGIGSCDISVPLTGQGGVTQGAVNTIPPPGARAYWVRGYFHTSSIGRSAVAGTAERDYVLTPQPNPAPSLVHVQNWADPNAQRWEPVRIDPKGKPSLEVGYGTPVAEPTPFANPELAYEPDYQWGYQIGIQPGPATPIGPGNPAPVDPVTPGKPVTPINPVVREPPKKNEKQRKVLTKTAKIGIALYKAIDAASESAEIVDAIYDALPDDVKKRWDRPDRVGDNFGQYGVDGADWKLQALYYNWHRVDVEGAIKNIIKNELTDRIIGGMQGVLPNNAGQAHSQGEKKLAKLLDEWFDREFGL